MGPEGGMYRPNRTGGRINRVNLGARVASIFVLVMLVSSIHDCYYLAVESDSNIRE